MSYPEYFVSNRKIKFPVKGSLTIEPITERYFQWTNQRPR